MLNRNINGYVIKNFKGSGSFGTVYSCEKNEKTYAIKIFSFSFVFAEFSKGDDNRITREITALKSVAHPNIVSYIDDGEFFDNGVKYLYVIMDYVDGQDLAHYIQTTSISSDEATALFKEILSGVEAIHAQNIVHRDLKPANIYITKSGQIKILDFGLSKLIDFTSITSTGAEIGSPLYMSPEQVKDGKNVDYRSDYYALGIIFYELLSKNNPYGKVQSRAELYYKIITEPPISIRQFVPNVSNTIDNLLSVLLEKENYKRPNNIDEILKYLESSSTEKTTVQKEFTPSFFLRTWNEKTVIESYQQDGYDVENYIFPINHQNQQKNLLNKIIASGSNFMIDPATMRLAYDTFSEVKGLVSLPYAPKGLNRLELEDLKTLSSKQEYVKKVVEAQIRYNPTYIVSPFHVSNNSNLVKIKATDDENWFSLDVKLLYETKDYLSSIDCTSPLIGGFCIKTDILTTKTEREYFLNVVSALPCDIYWVYVDCIDNSSNLSQLYHYANTLLTLQKSTNKPVIAGRIGSFGLVLLAFGLFGFESGASRFETFYEDLYKNASDSYNMYLNYYFPELMRNVPIERKNPAKIIRILSSTTSKDISCSCPYCYGKKPEDLVNEPLSKKHFLFRRQEEINKLRSFSTVSERVEYIETCIKNAIHYHQELTPIFKSDDYNHFKTWLTVIQELKKEWL
ncbi:MAG: serine/threonine-protein kinase [Acidaminococcaceae bacterium]